MGNCAAPGEASQIESGMAVGMLSKNSMISKNKQGAAMAPPSLSSNIFISLNLYTKIEGFIRKEPKPDASRLLEASINSTEVSLNETSEKSPKVLDPSSPSPDKSLKQQTRPVLLNYTLKYGDNEMNWVEKNCHHLHKSKKIKLEYKLGYSD